MSNLLPQVYLVNCRDRRLLNLIEQVFSSEMKIPSLKFSLLCSYAGFILLCMIGIMSESMGLNQVATVIKVAMLVWFGILAGMLSPVFYFASQHDQGPWILAIFIPMTLLLVPLWKYLSQPSTIELDSIGIRSLFVIGPFRFSHAIEWN